MNEKEYCEKCGGFGTDELIKDGFKLVSCQYCGVEKNKIEYHEPRPLVFLNHDILLWIAGLLVASFGILMGYEFYSSRVIIGWPGTSIGVAIGAFFFFVYFFKYRHRGVFNLPASLFWVVGGTGHIAATFLYFLWL